jgi:hypothetical protein
MKWRVNHVIKDTVIKFDFYCFCHIIIFITTQREGRDGSPGIAPTRNCTHYFKIWLVVTGSYYIHQGNKLYKEMKIVRKVKLWIPKWFNTFFKRCVQFRLGEIPRLVYQEGLLEIKLYDGNQVKHKVAWGLGEGFLISIQVLSSNIPPFSLKITQNQSILYIINL